MIVQAGGTGRQYNQEAQSCSTCKQQPATDSGEGDARSGEASTARQYSQAVQSGSTIRQHSQAVNASSSLPQIVMEEIHKDVRAVHDSTAKHHMQAAHAGSKCQAAPVHEMICPPSLIIWCEAASLDRLALAAFFLIKQFKLV